MCVFDPSYSKNLLNLWVRLWLSTDRYFLASLRANAFASRLLATTLSTDLYFLASLRANAFASRLLATTLSTDRVVRPNL